jgi:sugar O-acyltransferase (sialic acid O-acetyltransferase NeuD family)
MKPILVLGTTAYATVFIDSFESIAGVEFTGCVENLDRSKCEGSILGLPIYWYEEIDGLRHSHLLACALGTTLRDAWINGMLERGFGFARLLHPSAVVSRRSDLADGVAVDAGTVLAGFTTVAPHVRIGRRCSIGHHTEIGPFTTIHPGSIISGNCKIGRQVTVGSGAVIIDGIEIGDGAVVAAGAVVTRAVEARTMIAGNPATVRRTDYGPR